MPSYFLALAAFFIPIKPAPANIFLVLSMLSVLAFVEHRKQLLQALSNPIGFCSVGFFTLVLLSQFYSNSTWADASDYISKYARIAYIPFLAAAVLNPNQVVRVLVGFSAGMAFTLVLSYGIAIDPSICTVLGLSTCGPESNPTVFKLHITQNYFMALAAALWAYAFTKMKGNANTGPLAWVSLVFALMALINVLFMVDGRTGWVVLAVLLSYLLFLRMGVKGVCISAVVVIAALALVLTFSATVNQLLVNAYNEYQLWLQNGVAPGRSGMRLTYYSHAVQAIAQSPWFGHGIGGVREAMNLQSAGDPNLALNNPHNQYLLFAVQTGLLGLVVYGAYLYLLFKLSRKSRFQVLYVPFLLTFCVGNLFNSFHFDMSEAMLFALVTALLIATILYSPNSGKGHVKNSHG